MNLRKKIKCLGFPFKYFSNFLWKKGALFVLLWPGALLVFCLLGFSSKANVSHFPDKQVDYTKISSIQLVSPYKSILKNTKKIPIGLWVSLSQGWHSYWQNPGESARPLKVRWILPAEGFAVSAFKWPFPERIKFGSFIQFVYKKSFLLTAELSNNQGLWTTKPVAKNAVTGKIANNQKSLTLKVEADWLICRELCVPLSQKVEKTWFAQSETSDSPIKDPYWSAIFAKWSHQMPKAKQSILKPIKTNNKKYQFQIFTDKKSQLIDVFPLSKNQFSLKPPEILLTGGLQHSFALSQAKAQKRKQKSGLDSKKEGHILAVFKTKNKTTGVIHSTAAKGSYFFWFLFLAFLGGLILNFMPCVLPVVFLKFSHVLEQQKTGAIIQGNLFYSAGVVCSFIFLASVLVMLKKGGQSLGWGFQMQSPYFLSFLIFLFVLISASFMGRLPFSLPSLPFFQGGKNNFKHFLTGVLSTASASPCTAPFMGAATGYAFSENPLRVIMIFLFLGVGLSFPYLLLSLFPQWIKYVPRPGAWNHKLKQFMAFPMLATAIWLIHLLSKQRPEQLPHLLFSLLFLALGFWILSQGRKISLTNYLNQKSPRQKNNIKKAFFNYFAYALILCALFYPFVSLYRGGMNTQDSGIFWQDFSLEKVNRAQKEGKTLFINFTADWCLTCQWNEIVTFKNQKVIQFFKEQDIYALKGDLTHKNPEITAFLERYQRAGIPFYLYISPKKTVLLPELLSPSKLFKHLKSPL